MKQVLQHLRSGEVEIVDVPCPPTRPGYLLIQTRTTLISAGTERMLVEFGKGSLLAKARSQPDKVKQVLDKIKTDGLLPTLETVFARLDEPLPLGYCNAGVVVDVGDGVTNFKIGDRVVSNGPHAEMVCVPNNLCARIPPEVSDEQAAFVVLASIGLQGIRLIQPTLGESVVVVGLGLIGLMTVQMLRANGCRVLGIDIDQKRLELARDYGAETVNVAGGADPVASAMAFSSGQGADAVLVTASSKSNDIMKQAAEMCRKLGRIVLVGVVGLELSRADFYKKELTFQVSCSYGPGRYDPGYEEAGCDYPLGYVRWTEQRNFEAILGQMADGSLDVASLVSDRIEHANAAQAYCVLTEQRDAMGILLTYPDQASPSQTVITLQADRPSVKASGKASIGVIGAGNFAKMTGLPAIKKTDARLVCIADIDGAAASHVGRKFGFERMTTDYKTILDDEAINTVLIFTRHDMHARFVKEVLAAGKNVFVEKPLCLREEELVEIREAYEAAKDCQLLVGFNRRFSPHAKKMKELLANRTQPLCMSMMVNAGVIPSDVWVHDPKIGGGRILGEGCHWLDLMSFLAGSPIVKVVSTLIGESPGVAIRDDKTSITLTFGDGSLGTLHYFGNGDKSYPKETMEVFSDGKVLRLDNFRRLTGYGWSGFSKMKLRRMDKGHGQEFRQWVQTTARGGAEMIPFGQIENVMKATFAAVESGRSGEAIQIG